MTDDVLQGVRKAREAFAAKYGYDIRAMVAALRAMDEADDWPVVRLSPRKPEGDAVPRRDTGLAPGATPDQLPAESCGRS